MSIKNRIIGTGVEPVDSILFNPSNWRIHPTRQQDAVRGSLNRIGWVETVLINVRSGEAWPPGERGVQTLVDGHMRVTLAARGGETEIPVTYVDLDPEEEAFILATLDPLGALAGTDSSKLLELAQELNDQDEVIRAALRGAGMDIRQVFAHIEPVGASGGQTGPVSGDDDEPVERAPRVQQAPAAAPVTSKPADRERYPLAIVLDKEYYDRWLAWKETCDQRSDTAALRALLDNAEA